MNNQNNIVDDYSIYAAIPTNAYTTPAEYIRAGNNWSFLSCAVSTKILRGPQGERTANRSQRAMTPKTTHVVQFGRYLMKIRAINAEIKTRYAC